MALQAEAIDHRLEGLKQDERRMMFDSKLRAFRRDEKPPAMPGARASKLDQQSEPQYSAEQVIAILEELSRRIEGLEKGDRVLTVEIRRRAHHDRLRHSFYLVCGFATGTILVANWVLHWI